MLWHHFKRFKFMAGPRSPTSPVTAQLILQGWGSISFWCYADCQQRSNQRLVVLPQTRSSFFHSVKAFSRLDGMKLFKNDQVNAWGLILQTRPSFFHVVEKLFRLDVMQPFKPFKFMAGPRSPTSPVTAQLILQGWGVISFWCYADCQQRSNQRLVVLHQTRSNSFHGVKHLSRLGGMKLFKIIRIHGWAVLPQTRPSSFQGWGSISFWCYADCQHRLNERLVVLPQTRSSFFHSVKAISRLDGMKLFKNDQVNAWGLILQTRPSFFHVVEKPFRLDVMQPIKNF